MKLLIIEDHLELCNSMKKALEKEKFNVDIVHNGILGEEKAYTNEYDAILLDLNLPDKDGIEILKFLRSEGVITPVIIITARDEIEHRANGLDLGADDYIVKPFQILELKSRVHAVIRRYHGRTNPIIFIGSLSLNPISRVVKWKDTIIPLMVKEFDILSYVAMKYPAVVSSEEIVEHIYGEEFDPFSSVLRVHLTRLRKKLFLAVGTDVLMTMRGKGYYLCLKEK